MYADLKWKDIKFQIGDKIFLKVLRFGRKRKLSPRFIGLYEILERIGHVAYRLTLPPELEKIQNVFHVSMLCRYNSDLSHPDLSYNEEPVRILAWEVTELRNKSVSLVKVLWHRHGIKEATWEIEKSMKSQYTNLFSSKNFEDEISFRVI
ncbi:pol protein [Gossypium australe]|uniref:Pol protein n=1 Tax=Gossypium australe TaxID=47621 RepID=A0A5B6WTT9_9ROSI|nr:pol protein [Gossypium australe]